MTRSRTLGTYALVVILFGGGFPAIEVALTAAPPLLLAAGRYYCSAALILGYAVVRTDYWWPRTPDDRVAVLVAGTLMIGASGLLFVALEWTSGGVAAIVFSAIPILTVLVGWFVLPDERPTGRGLLGIGVGFVGILLVLAPGSATAPGSAAPAGAPVFGTALVLLTAVAITAGTIAVSETHHPMPVPGLTGWAMVVGATIQLTVGLAAGESPWAVRPTVPALAAFCYLAVFASGIGFVLYLDLLEDLGPLKVSTTRYLTPVVAVGVGWALLDEPVGTTVLVGFAVILLGFVLLENRALVAELAKYRGAAR